MLSNRRWSFKIFYIIGALLCLSYGAMLLTPMRPATMERSEGVEPPCGAAYGTPEDGQAIEQAMYAGTAQDVVAAINAAKRQRGNRVGCPEKSYSYKFAGATAPTLADVERMWTSIHAPRLAAYTIGCPLIGRTAASTGLGGYYARLAGSEADLPALADIGRMLEAQQYSDAHAPWPPVTTPGAFGYLYVDAGDPCRLGGVPGEATQVACTTVLAEYCVSYDAGLFAGETFGVADINPEAGVFDGGIGYDQGWSGVFMVEAVLQQPDPALRRLFQSSALLAGEWAIAEPPVRNHNYTAKLVWLLAQLYGWTGQDRYREALLDKLHRNLLPGVLMDHDADGLVDGMPHQPFEELAEVAQRPGRMWDGHNALPWYGAMNAWAVVEAYVALRDRGDTALAAEVRPYAIAMLDNLAWEIVNWGGGEPSTPGAAAPPYALMVGLWKIAAYEDDPHPAWEQAAWRLWNAGLGNSFGRQSANVGLYLLYLSETPYTPLHRRSVTVYLPWMTR